MISYKEKILKVIDEAKMGLTTVDVAKKAGVSKTTVIKYLSVLSSEGQVEFVEVGPAKLWRTKSKIQKQEKEQVPTSSTKSHPVVDIDFLNGEDDTIYFSFRVDPDQICPLLKLSKKCACKGIDS